jgi:hypothetical protein
MLFPKDGFWLVGDTPSGPFAMVTEVPDAISKTPWIVPYQCSTPFS